MRADSSNTEAPETLGLQALAWTLADERRASRLLDTTGLNAGELRGRAGDPAVLGAVLGFLAAYEPDLIACADALGVAPAALVAAYRALDGTEPEA